MNSNTIAQLRAKPIEQRVEHLWKNYLKWPVPIWRLRRHAMLRVGNHHFKFCTDDVTLWWLWRVYQGDWEEQVARFLQQVIRPDDVFFDVGAYIGGYALLASRLVQRGCGHVYAFEPDPVARALLKRNLALNRAANVTVLPCALAAHVGGARLKGSTWLDTGEFGTSDSMVTAADGAVDIEATTLSEFCARHHVAPSVVKIDTPGGEDKVIAGGLDVLRHARATIVEMNERKLREAGQDPSVFLDSLFDLGKRVFVLHSWSDNGYPPGTEITPATATPGHMNLAVLDSDSASLAINSQRSASAIRTRTLRIALYVPEDSFLDPGYSGDHVVVRSLVHGLRQRGHHLTIASYLDPARFGAGDISLRRLVAEGVAVRRRMKRFAPDAWLVYAPSDDRPDVFGWWQGCTRYVLFAAHAPVNGQRSWSWRTAVLSLAHRRSLARADVITAFRHPSYDRLKAYGIPEARLRLFPPAVQSWQWLPSQEGARRRLGVPLDIPIILCVGRFSVGKEGHEPRKTEMMLDLIEAVKPLPPEVLLIIVGDGPGRPQLEAAAAQLEQDGRVRFAGYVTHEELHWYYAACDFYAFPHPKDDSWVSVLEAQYCGRPVVTMRTRSGEITVEDGRTGLLAADLEEFGAHVAKLAASRTVCVTMGAAARAYIAEHHSMETRIAQIEDLVLGRGCA